MNERKTLEAATFDSERLTAQQKARDGEAYSRFVRDDRGWILFGPTDIRGGKTDYLFCLQKLKGHKHVFVRVGCRYYDLKQAWKHWAFKAKTGRLNRRARWGLTAHKNEGKQAVAIIRLMLVQAQALHLISEYSTLPKFDSSLMRKKR